MTQAAAATHASSSPGLFMLAWGLFGSAFGLLIVANFGGPGPGDISGLGRRKDPPPGCRRV